MATQTPYEILEQEVKERSAELARSEARYRTMFALAAVGIGEADPDSGRITNANARFCEITGYSKEELLQVPLWDLTHPEDREGDQLLFRKMISGEIPAYRNEKRYVRKDGTVI